VGKVRVNVGTKERGYVAVVNHEDYLQRYLDNVADKYEGDFIERNKELEKDWLANRDLSKYAKLIGVTFLGAVALIGLMTTGDVTLATDGIIDISPLERFFNTVYWTMFRVLMYISTPVWAWVGFILATGGANSEKRTQAKKVASGLVIGTAITASAPYLTRVVYGAWKFFT
jgi:hypothetical protein